MKDTAHSVRYCLVNGAGKVLGARLANAAVKIVVAHADYGEPVARLGPLLFEVRRALEPDGVALVLCARPDLLPLAALGTRSGFDADPPCLWHTGDGPRWLLPLRRRGGKGPMLPVIARDEDDDPVDAWRAVLTAIFDRSPDASDEDDGGWLVELDARDSAFAKAAFAMGTSWLGNARPATRGDTTEPDVLADALDGTGVRAASVVPGILQETILMARPTVLPQLFPTTVLAPGEATSKRPRRRGRGPVEALPMFEATGTD